MRHPGGREALQGGPKSDCFMIVRTETPAGVNRGETAARQQKGADLSARPFHHRPLCRAIRGLKVGGFVIYSSHMIEVRQTSRFREWLDGLTDR